MVHSTRSGADLTDDQERIGTLNWFQNNPYQVSAHYVGDATGGLTPVVPLVYAAGHAGFHNSYSVGVELTQPLPDTPYTQGHYEAAALAFDLTNHWLALMGASPIPPRHVFSGLERGVIGHDETEQGRASGKSDPGEPWQWDYFLSLLK